MTEQTARELLEKAARAAGIELGPVGNEIGGAHFDGEGLCKYSAAGFITWRWSPLIDDGDALRLAVKLNIDAGNPGMRLSIDWRTGEDPYAATRRAIVRAAASMGGENA